MQHLLARAGHQQPGTQGYSSRALSEQTHFCSHRQESLNSLTGKNQSQSYTLRAETLSTKEGEEEKKRHANNRKHLLTKAMPVQLGYKKFQSFLASHRLFPIKLCPLPTNSPRVLTAVLR